MVGNRVQSSPIKPQRVQNQVTWSQYPIPTPNLANILKNPRLSFVQLVPLLKPLLDRDKSIRLETLYGNLRRNEVSKEGFVGLMKEIVGDQQMIEMPINKLQTQEAQNAQAGSSQPPQLSSQYHQKADSNNAMAESNGQCSEDMEIVSDFHGKYMSQINMKQEREHFHFPQRGFYGSRGGNNCCSVSGSNVNSLAVTSSLTQQGLDTHTSQGPGYQSVSGAHSGTSNQYMNAIVEAMRNSSNSLSTSTMHPSPVTRSITAQLNLQKPHGVPSAGSGNDAKTPPKKPSIGQKKPHEPLVSSPPQSNKKQKVSGSLADQSIEQLNDVTAVSGVNIREEEEQLFSGSKDDSRVSEASQRVVKEEEERLILQKTPLQKKLAEIMSKYGVKNMNGDVEQCSLLGVEERMRVLISCLIRLSKQRVDIENSRHTTVITSDVWRQIMEINQKAREEWDMKQSEAEKLQKPYEAEGRVEDDKEKEDVCAKSLQQTQLNKAEDDKMRAIAANVAARAAVGDDGFFSKWQLMAEQACQKRESGSHVAIFSQQGKDISLRTSSSLAEASKDNQETVRSGQQNAVAAFGSSGKSVRGQLMPQTKVARSISVKDVISILEREPQMSKGKLLYCLYEKSSAEIVT